MFHTTIINTIGSESCSLVTMLSQVCSHLRQHHLRKKRKHVKQKRDTPLENIGTQQRECLDTARKQLWLCRRFLHSFTYRLPAIRDRTLCAELCLHECTHMKTVKVLFLHKKGWGRSGDGGTIFLRKLVAAFSMLPSKTVRQSGHIGSQRLPSCLFSSAFVTTETIQSRQNVCPHCTFVAVSKSSWHTGQLYLSPNPCKENIFTWT
jgi:hypothetical protein